VGMANLYSKDVNESTNFAPLKLQSRRKTQNIIPIDTNVNKIGELYGRNSKITNNSAKKTLKNSQNHNNDKSYVPVSKRHQKVNKNALPASSSINSNKQTYFTQNNYEQTSKRKNSRNVKMMEAYN
jgi:hypothetical protein